MADIHVLTGSYNQNNNSVTKRVVFHYSVPAPDQVAEASQDPDLIAFTSAVPDIQTSEENSIKAGTVVEVVDTVTFNLNKTPAERLALIRSMWTAGQADALNQYRARYYEYLSPFTSS